MRKHFSKEEFMKLAGVKSRQHLHQLMKGQKRGGYDYPPVLIEGKDFENVGLIFFESALKKIEVKTGHAPSQKKKKQTAGLNSD